MTYESGTGERAHDDALDWENLFQIAETGRYPVEVGLFTEIEFPRDRSEGFELRLGALFQTEVSKTQFNGNLLLQRQLRAVTDPDEPHITELRYPMQAKYRLTREFEFGTHAFGELSRCNHWDISKQNHRIDTAAFGGLPVGDHQGIRYDVAWLIGASKSAPESTLRLRLEYEF